MEGVCPRCDQHESYGCGCTSQELVGYYRNLVAKQHSWRDYARPFARRVAVYRKKQVKAAARGDFEYAERAIDYILAVQFAWCAFRDAILNNREV